MLPELSITKRRSISVTPELLLPFFQKKPGAPRRPCCWGAAKSEKKLAFNFLALSATVLEIPDPPPLRLEEPTRLTGANFDELSTAERTASPMQRNRIAVHGFIVDRREWN